MKYTLLELVQSIASSMDSDEVTTINGSVEAEQIATVVRTAYYDIITRTKLPEHYTLFNLTEVANTNTPVIMTLPTNVSKVEWLQYDAQTAADTDVNYQDVKFLPMKDFLDMVNGFDVDETFVDSMTYTMDGGNSFTFYYYNDRAPMYFTSVDDYTLIFDAYDSDVDTFLTASKTRAFGPKIITWEMSDAYIPDLDEPQFALLLNEAKALAWAELKQTQHPKAEQSARRHWIRSLRTKEALDEATDFSKLPNFGRK